LPMAYLRSSSIFRLGNCNYAKASTGATKLAAVKDSA
jgi:hypothetical protein